MPDAAAPRSPRLLDRRFRWRGTEVTRLEGFSDAVFAIVLALLFLRAAPPETFTDLCVAMKSLVPFAVTFAILAYIWFEHWIFSRRYGLHDVPTTLLNLALLFLVLFYAYPVKYLFTFVSVSIWGPIGSLTPEHMAEGMRGGADVARLFTFYGVGYGLIFGVIAMLYQRAFRRGDELDLSPIERHLTRSAMVQCLLHTAVALLSIVLALLCPQSGLPGWIYFAIGPLMAVHGAWERRRMPRA